MAYYKHDNRLRLGPEIVVDNRYSEVIEGIPPDPDNEIDQFVMNYGMVRWRKYMDTIIGHRQRWDRDKGRKEKSQAEQ